jgi:hypothetical protein
LRVRERMSTAAHPGATALSAPGINRGEWRMNASAIRRSESIGYDNSVSRIAVNARRACR